MKLTNYNFKNMINCKNYYFLNQIYDRKKLVSFNLKEDTVDSILKIMFDENGNDNLETNDLTMKDYYDLLHNKMKEFILEKVTNKKIDFNKLIKINYKNVNFECDYDAFMEDENNINFIKFMSCKINTLEKEIGKRNVNLVEVNDKMFNKIYNAEIKKDLEVIKEKLFDIYYYKFIYENSNFYNPYKKQKYYLILLTEEIINNNFFNILDITNVINNSYNIFINIIDNFLKNISNNEIILEKNCENKNCKFYQICKNKSSKTKNEVVEIIDKEKLIYEFDKITYPIYYLDFETFSSPYPRFKGDKPYTVFTFQYSLIIQKEKDSELIYKDYLPFDNINDIRYDLFSKLVQDIDLTNGGTVLVYNDSCEKNRILDACELFPNLKDKLININNHMLDLLRIVKGSKDHHNYYNSLQENSYSIKKLLPALTSKSYDNLDIKQGTEASVVYANFNNFNEEELEKYRNDLIIYCRQDTKSMYDILKVLKEKVSYTK